MISYFDCLPLAETLPVAALLNANYGRFAMQFGKLEVSVYVKLTLSAVTHAAHACPEASCRKF